MELNNSENSLVKETKKKRKKKKKKILTLEENACDEQPEYIPLPSTLPVANSGKGPDDANAADIQAGEETALEESAAQEGAFRRPYWMSNCSSIKSPLLRLHQGQFLHTALASTGTKLP